MVSASKFETMHVAFEFWKLFLWRCKFGDVNKKTFFIRTGSRCVFHIIRFKNYNQQVSPRQILFLFFPWRRHLFQTKDIERNVTKPNIIIINYIAYFFQLTVSVLQTIVRKHLGDEIPPLYELSKNVSFILQNSHFSVSYPRAYMPHVAEIACIHCKAAKALPHVRKMRQHLENM